jgi:hypothetical protein
MEQSDIKEVLHILKHGYKIQDWDSIEEAIEYLTDFCDDDVEVDEDN